MTTSPTSTIDTAGEVHPLSRGQVVLLALVAGVSVASMYYVQPLLNTVAGHYGVSTARASLLVTASQVGYVLGMALVVPLGDRTDRRRLLVTVMCGSAVMLAISAAAPSFWSLFAALVGVGLTASGAMVAVPFAAALARPEDRSRVTGSVMSGLLLGILFARTVAGGIADLTSWRVVFAVGAVAVVALAGLVRSVLAEDTHTKDDRSYLVVLASIASVVRAEPALRARMALGGLVMFSFSAMWTSIAFLLSRHYGYGEGVIGLFGLVGAAGAAGAPLAGRMADRQRGRLATTIGWLSVAGGWLLLWWGGHVLAALIVGLLVFDFGAQTCQVSNQSRIYALAPELRSRITTAYMVTYFVGGVIGSLVSGVAYAGSGWTGVCLTGVATSVVALALWATFARRKL
jgi:predicted MFS family arabinose efflux permease